MSEQEKVKIVIEDGEIQELVGDAHDILYHLMFLIGCIIYRNNKPQYLEELAESIKQEVLRAVKLLRKVDAKRDTGESEVTDDEHY